VRKIDLTVGNRKIVFTVQKMLNLGRTGKDPIEVRKHLEELKKDGIEASIEMPSYNPKIKDKITTNGEIEVLPNSKSSGEVEFVFLFNDESDIFVTVGSDHTDRELAKTNMIFAKNIYPNIISSEVWRYEEVKDHWDDLIMRSWIKKYGKRQLYQEGNLAKLLSPKELFKNAKLKIHGDLKGAIVFCGTFPTLGGELCYSSYFEMELLDEQRKRSIKHIYNVKPIEWFVI